MRPPSCSTPWPLKTETKVRNRKEFDERLKLDTRRPNIIPDRFDGKVAWKDYRQHFEACRVANGWDRDQSAAFLAASLQGDQGAALKVLGRRHGEGNCPRYEELISLLEAQFGPGQMAENYLMEL